MPPPILFIHGMWSRPSAFAKLRAELSAVGIESTAPALPFHEVPPGAPAPEGLAGLGLEDYVDALAPQARALGPDIIVCGHSMGGLLAQLLAVRVQPRGLILLATGPSATTGAQALAPFRTLVRVTSRWGWWRKPTLLDAAGARFGVYGGVPEPEVTEAIAELTWDSGRVLAQMAFPGLDRSHGARVDYARLTMPSLLVIGSADRMTTPAITRNTARALAAGGARVEVEEVQGAGHWLFHDAVRPKIAGAISRFAASL
jgi:pimeloyl-ACP methyl ester carboxylesterase